MSTVAVAVAVAVAVGGGFLFAVGGPQWVAIVLVLRGGGGGGGHFHRCCCTAPSLAARGTAASGSSYPRTAASGFLFHQPNASVFHLGPFLMHFVHVVLYRKQNRVLVPEKQSNKRLVLIILVIVFQHKININKDRFV